MTNDKEPSLDRVVMTIEGAQTYEWGDYDRSKFEMVEDARDELNAWLNAHDGGDR